MNEFRITCPGCQQHLMCVESHRGTQFPCPTCGATITVPASTEAPPPVGLRIPAAATAAASGRGSHPRFGRERHGVSRPQGKNWLTTILLAWFLGQFGVDRFYSGRIGLGIGKLLTLGACGVWSLVDVVLLLTKSYQDGQGYSLRPAKRSHMTIALSIIGVSLLIQFAYAYGVYRDIRSEFGDALANAKDKAASISCVNNLKQVGLAFRIFANDNDDLFPFNVPAANGGTLEFRQTSADGFDGNAYRHFLVLSNELSVTMALLCPADASKTRAADWTSFGPSSVSYRLRTGTAIKPSASREVLVECPIHGHRLFVDGSVTQGEPGPPKASQPMPTTTASQPMAAGQVQGFASPQAVFEAMKADPHAITLLPPEERAVMAYTMVGMARLMSAFATDETKKGQLEQGFKDLITKHHLNDSLEFSATEDPAKIRTLAARSLANVDLEAFWTDLNAYLNQPGVSMMTGDEAKPVTLKGLVIDGNEARGTVVSSDATEEQVVFVKSAAGWFLSFENTHMDPDDPFATTTQMSLRVTFDSEASLNAATANGLLESVTYDRSSPASLEKAEAPLQAYLTFMIAISADRDTIVDTVKRVRGVREVARSLGREFDEGMTAAAEEFKEKVKEAFQNGEIEIQVDGGARGGPTASANRPSPTGSVSVPAPTTTTGDLNRLAARSAQNPSDTLLAMKVAALQVWFDQDEAYDQTRKRMLAWAARNGDPAIAERVAKIASLRPSPSILTQQDALNLARKAVAQGATDPYLPWFQMALGMAEFRLGLDDAADQSLRNAINGARTLDAAMKSRVLGTSNYYRVMNLLRQGQRSEALELFGRTETAMPPAPANKQDLMVNQVDHDDLILWLAYEEAKTKLAELNK